MFVRNIFCGAVVLYDETRVPDSAVPWLCGSHGTVRHSVLVVVGIVDEESAAVHDYVAQRLGARHGGVIAQGGESEILACDHLHVEHFADHA
ncbi:hypothetical protein E2C01_005678 [Portunus trituberculatus]|uniref:Uncharacterized protein n=1 Tax=Portunus trituberculatus TaxID=210409 RepID=A0A5B7CVP1_PORTR|nr:hypothetical protein [Portunus trituberculatus]